MQNVGVGGEVRQGEELNRAARSPGADGHFFTKVNGVTVLFREPLVKGEEILDKAGLKPAGDYILIQLLGHSTQSIELDEMVDLRIAGTEEFRAFKNDRVYRFTLNGHGFDWGVEKLPEPELRQIGHVHVDEVVVLDRDGEEIDLGPGDVLDLARPGTEHLHTEKRLIIVFFENEPREIHRGIYTTEQLKQIFGVQDGYILEYINAEGQLTPLKPNAKLRVKQDMRFFEQVPCGGSS